MDEPSSSMRILARLQHDLYDWLLSQGFEPDVSVLLTALAGVIAMLVLAIVTDVLARLVLAKLIPGAVNRLFGSDRAAVWQAALRRQMLTRRSAHIVAALAAYLMTPQVLSAYPSVVLGVRNLIEGYVILVMVIAINAVLRATADVSRNEGWPTGLPPKFLAQTGQGIVWLVGSILVISAVFDKSVGVLLTSLAGMTAVLILVFRDSLLGFVAGIQIVNNDLVREGDRIDIPKYGADGTVIDIGLMTVKVQNFDKTISSVPSYALISDGFKNWRGMQESGGRRIMRALPIDMSGVSFCSGEMLERLRKIEILREYIDHRLEEVEAFNREHDVDETEPANGRRLTNIGTYRAYLQRYLQRHPAIRNDMRYMVRQLAPGPDGLLIEIYAFSANQEWKEYETIQADIIDHALAVLPAFGLSVYQYPSSGAFRIPDAGH